MIQLDKQRSKQLTYIGISEQDLDFLSSQAPLFKRITNTVVDELYDRIYRQPELKKIITEHTTIERLKETQRWYFQSMVDGKIDTEFVEKRLFIGKVHSRIGLTTEWYLGTYMLYLDIAIENFKKEAPEHWAELMMCVSKMFNFDSQLVLEAYEQDEKQKVQDLADQKQNTLTKISDVVQNLAAMMVELNGSTKSIAETATYTAEIQDSAHRQVEALRSKVEEIQDVGYLLQEITDRTHLIGLNAAIEAAHANEFGRGFGVIATEIRKLASHSKESLQTITENLKEISNVLQEVTKSTEQTSRFAREQAASSEELASFVNMIDYVTNELEQI